MATIQIRRDTAAGWTSADPTLAAGEKGRETDTGKEKTGDGATAWSSLPYDSLGLAESAGTTVKGVVASGTFYWSGSAVVTNNLENVTSVARNSAGNYTVTLSITMDDDQYPVLVSGSASSGAAINYSNGIQTRSTTTFVVETEGSDGAGGDPGSTYPLSFAVIGNVEVGAGPITVENGGLTEILTDRDFEESAGSWRPIYSLKVDVGAMPNATSKSVAHGVSNISRIIAQYGEFSNGTNYQPLPYVQLTVANQILLYCDITNVYLNTGYDWSSFSGTVTIEYTKTTDTATSTPRNTALGGGLSESAGTTVKSVVASGTFYWNGSAVVTNNLENVTSVARNSAGNYTVTLSITMDDDQYPVLVSGSTSSALTKNYSSGIQTRATTTFVVEREDSGGNGSDPDSTYPLSFAVIGDVEVGAGPITVENGGFTEILTDRDFEESAGSWRPIYQKVVSIGALPNATTKNVAHSVSDISKWVTLNGAATDSSGNCRPMPHVGLTGDSRIEVYITGTDIIVNTGTTDRSDYNGYMLLEYTKTTDTATSSPRSTALGGGSGTIEHTFDGSTSSVTFDVSVFGSGISKIVIEGLVRSAETGADVDVLMVRFNSDTGSNYDSVYYEVNASVSISGSSSDGAAVAAIRGPSIPAANAQANAYATLELQIPYFRETAGYKGITGQGGCVAAASPGDTTISAQSFWGQWRNTAAITSITIYTLSTDNLTNGSRIKLRGV